MLVSRALAGIVLLFATSCGQASDDMLDEARPDGGSLDAASDSNGLADAADAADARSDEAAPPCVLPELPTVAAPTPEVIATEQLHADSIVATDFGVTWHERDEWIYSQFVPPRAPRLVDWSTGQPTERTFFGGVGARLLYRGGDVVVFKAIADVEVSNLVTGAIIRLQMTASNVFASAIFQRIVYWTDDEGISQTPVVDGARELVFSGEAGHLAVDDDGYFFSSGIEDSYALYRLKTPLGQPIRLAALTVGTAMLTTSSSHVYQIVWPELNMDPNGQITRVPKTGGDPEIVADNQGRPQRIVTDDDFAYWTTASTAYESVEPYGTHAVMMVPHCGSTPIVVADNEPAPVDIAVDDHYIYWVNFGEHGDVRRVPKRWWK